MARTKTTRGPVQSNPDSYAYYQKALEKLGRGEVLKNCEGVSHETIRAFALGKDISAQSELLIINAIHRTQSLLFQKSEETKKLIKQGAMTL
ncbi:hypothetical protein [Larkinella arboricola]